MSAPTPAAIPHRLRLWAILIATLLDVAALIALRLDVAPELIGEIRPLVDSALYAVLGLLVLGLGDAYMVERRRRTPGIPALPDDDQVGNGGPHIVAPLPWPPPPTPPDPPRRSSTFIEPSEPYPPAPPDPPVGGAGLALVLVILAASLSVATSGCSTGPQTVPQATPINISCTWHENACPRVFDGGIAPHAENGSTASDEQPGSATGSITVGGCDCYVDRATSGAEATTQGNVIRDNTVNPQVEANVSGAQTQ